MASENATVEQMGDVGGDIIHSMSSIGTYTDSQYSYDHRLDGDEELDGGNAEDEADDTITSVKANRYKGLRRGSLSTTDLPAECTHSNRSIYSSIVLMPEQGSKWNQLSERGQLSKFCVIPVLEKQMPKVVQNDEKDVDESIDSAETTVDSTCPVRTLLARQALAMSQSNLSPVVEIPFGSAVNIHRSMRDVRRAKDHGQVLPDKNTLKKNFFLQLLSFFFTFTGYVPIRGMQTSLNHHENLGSISVSVIFASCIIGSLACPILVQRIGAKRTLCLSIIGPLCYVVGNFHAKFSTLLPASVVAGMGFSWMLGAQGAYQTNVAAAYSSVTQTKIEKVLPYFGGMYFTFLQLGNIVGNGLSSTILKLLGPVIDPDFYAMHNNTMDHHNVTIDLTTDELVGCGAEFNNVFGSARAKFHVSDRALYLLLGTLFLLICIGLFICTFFVGRLDCIFTTKDKSLWSHVKTVFSYHKERKTWLLLPVATYAAFGPAFTYGDVVKAYVTCPIGIDMIGYAIMCYAITSAILAFSSGHISRRVGPRTLMYFGFLGSTSMHVVMLLWMPSREEPYYIFMLFCGLGLTHATYQTTYYSMVGILFAGRTETAFSFFLMYQSTVAALVFALGPLVPMRQKLYFSIGYFALCCVAYTILGIVLKREKKEQVDIDV